MFSEILDPPGSRVTIVLSCKVLGNCLISSLITVVFPAPSGPSNVIKYPLMFTPTWHCTVKEKRKTDLFF